MHVCCNACASFLHKRLVHHCYKKGFARGSYLEGREVFCGTCTLMQFSHIGRLCLLCVYFHVLLCRCCREALLENMHVVVAVREVHSAVLLVLVDGIIVVVVIAVVVLVRLATAPMRLATAPMRLATAPMRLATAPMRLATVPMRLATAPF